MHELTKKQDLIVLDLTLRFMNQEEYKEKNLNFMGELKKTKRSSISWLDLANS